LVRPERGDDQEEDSFFDDLSFELASPVSAPPTSQSSEDELTPDAAERTDQDEIASDEAEVESSEEHTSHEEDLSEDIVSTGVDEAVSGEATVDLADTDVAISTGSDVLISADTDTMVSSDVGLTSSSDTVTTVTLEEHEASSASAHLVSREEQAIEPNDQTQDPEVTQSTEPLASRSVASSKKARRNGRRGGRKSKGKAKKRKRSGQR
jgi:hypothetical protein